ncbi:MAG: hypothetical protein KIT58_01700 [Planctomycetota bacterium]|nr:hypothetical protein [Planctomycetota bacterium]
MDYRKVDSALVAALEDAADNADDQARFMVQVHAGGSLEQRADFMRERRLDPAVVAQTPFTVELSDRDIDVLSIQPWVKFLELSKRANVRPPEPIASKVAPSPGWKR